MAQPVGIRALIARIRGSHGIRAGAILAVSTLVLNGSGYLYNIACIRYLGSRVYGDVAAMLALFALVTLPLGSVQILLAREVAQLPPGAVRSLIRRSVAISAAGGLSLVLIGLALV